MYTFWIDFVYISFLCILNIILLVQCACFTQLELRETCSDSNNTYKYLTSPHNSKPFYKCDLWEWLFSNWLFFLEKKVIPTNTNTTEPYRFTIFLRAIPPFPPECQLPRISSHATNAKFTRLVITYIPSWCTEGCTRTYICIVYIYYIYNTFVYVCVRIYAWTGDKCF